MLETLLEPWGVILLTETWRAAAEELFKLDSDCTFGGSAGAPDGRRRVGIIVHPECKLHRFVPLDPRSAYADISKQGVYFRLVVAYFPDSSYPDGTIQKMYNILETIRRETKANQYFILGGDFSAEVGSRLDDDDANVIGPNGMNQENSRWQWLKQRATPQQLTIANTFFSKPEGNKNNTYWDKRETSTNLLFPDRQQNTTTCQRHRLP